MSYNLYHVDFKNKELITIIEKSQESTFISKEMESRIELFYNIVSNIYYQQQINRKGIKNLGDKIRHDKNITEVFNSSEDYVIVKSTANRNAFTKLFLETFNKTESKNIFFLVLSKNLNRISQIFDPTSTTKDDIEVQLNLLKNFSGSVQLNHKIFILEITQFPNHQFVQTEEHYSRIYNK
jgi:predicted RNA methylase